MIDRGVLAKIMYPGKGPGRMAPVLWVEELCEVGGGGPASPRDKPGGRQEAQGAAATGTVPSRLWVSGACVMTHPHPVRDCGCRVALCRTVCPADGWALTVCGPLSQVSSTWIACALAQESTGWRAWGGPVYPELGEAPPTLGWLESSSSALSPFFMIIKVTCALENVKYRQIQEGKQKHLESHFESYF